jgi:hypothetical protein
MVGTAPSGDERLISALWGTVRGQEAQLVREMLAAKGLAGCSTFEVLCLGADETTEAAAAASASD